MPKSLKSDRFNVLPKHVAFIMDGNGRWATERGLSRATGHSAGVKTLKNTVKNVFSLGIPYMTVYAFSTENWKRSPEEIYSLMKLFRLSFARYFDKLIKDGIKVNVLGDVSAFPSDLRLLIKKTADTQIEERKGTLNVAMNYGSRDEIIRAVNTAVERGEKVDEKSFSELLFTAGMPDPDLVIRTSGEMRLSNFLLYQIAYSELYFCKKYWPDFNKSDLYSALHSFEERNRRYGKE